MANNATKAERTPAQNEEGGTMNCSVFDGVKNATPTGTATALEVCAWIKTDEVLAGKIEDLRGLAGTPAFGEVKNSLPACTWPGVFAPTRNKKTLFAHTGLIVLDFDMLENLEAAEDLRDVLGADRSCFTSFVSPSGLGVKSVFRVAGLAENPNQHEAAFDALKNYVEGTYGATVDPKGSDVCRLCFLSSDPGIKINPNATPFTIPVLGHRH